ncbi:MAG: type II toxin-antitoxin system VapC family toxin [Acidovorax sp.]|uniref:type II toxin-antitoxin system VapC family toxin n=1 Tax=Acidovorax sp. TaxID=1872122 RepID=UPI0039E3391D
MSVLVDSNILIYYINGQLPPAARACFENAVVAGASYSSITRIEVMGWAGHTPASRQLTQNLLSHMQEIPLAEAVIVQTIQLREQHRIKLPDAIIAASALAHGRVLMTRNGGDFAACGVQLLDPWDARPSPA